MTIVGRGCDIQAEWLLLLELGCTARRGRYIAVTIRRLFGTLLALAVALAAALFAITVLQSAAPPASAPRPSTTA